MTSKQDLMLMTLNNMDKKIDRNNELANNHAVKLGKVEEHLKTLNGRVLKAETRIKTAETSIQNQKIRNAKSLGIGGLGGGIVSGLIKLWDWIKGVL